MSTLVIQQVSAEGDFQVIRPQPFQSSKAVKVPSPYTWSVEGRPGSILMPELQWYLEKFLDYPFPPDTSRAERIRTALKLWGESAFEALFTDPGNGGLLQEATLGGYRHLTLQIASNDPGLLSWPWEALRDPRLGTSLAHACRIERRLGEIPDRQFVSSNLPQDRVNILLVVARPFGPKDVRFRSVARPLVELIAKNNLPAHVDLLRPPTFRHLREYLNQHREHYHILHFDGHGAYQGAEGVLVFEKDDGSPDPIAARQLNDLLHDCAVPGVVLNACQSAMVKQESKDAFSSVAAALLRGGAGSVVAMAYSLYVSGAQEFFPAFYRNFFETGSVAEATRAGRQQMRTQNQRVSVRGRFELDDWLLPVLYQQTSLDFSFATKAAATMPRSEPPLPEEFGRDKRADGFIGRDAALLELERAMRRPTAGILIHGLGGIGKTTLARGFVHWLAATSGLSAAPLWFDFREIRSAEFVLNRIGEALFGPNFAAAAPSAKLETLVKSLREQRFVIVWDNFESAKAAVPEDGLALLAKFLDGLRGGATKILITSRAEENWLGSQKRERLPLGGLDGEERWEYCEAILKELGRPVNRQDKDFAELMKQLAGHPLAMRVILLELEKRTAGEIAKALRGNLAQLKTPRNDAASRQLFGALRFVEDGLPESLRPLLVPLSLHESFIDIELLEAMAKLVAGDWSRAQIDELAAALTDAGLLRHRSHTNYELHPVLTGYLRSRTTGVAGGEAWHRAFAYVMALLADQSATPGPQAASPLPMHLANFRTALAETERLKMHAETQALTQALAYWAQRNHDFASADLLFRRLSRHTELAGTAYHQLGRLADERHDLEGGVDWYLKALETFKKQGKEKELASTYHQLGGVARNRNDFPTAEAWYRKALAIWDKYADEHNAAQTYHQLGILAERQNDPPSALECYQKSLALKEKNGEVYLSASTYLQLGNISLHQGALDSAEQSYRKAIAIWEKFKDERTAAQGYHQMGRVAEERGDLSTADEWYRKSLAIKERLGDEAGAAQTYHQLGKLAATRSDFDSAEAWYQKSLAVKQKLGNARETALTIGSIGRLAELQQRTVQAGQLYLLALTIFLQSHDSRHAQIALADFNRVHQSASPQEQRELERLWTEANLGTFPASVR
ncbi:MAG TPA: tetratricopeptide repeat protein [Bryobacteraceae bacterium]|nr:tetratricopeptide repeat protein [Bryobacteraceae bacterium]